MFGYFYVYSMHKRCIIGCIYAQKNAFANRYVNVKLFCLTYPSPICGQADQGRVSPPPPARRKKTGINTAILVASGEGNGYKFGHIRGENSGKTRLLKTWQKVAKNGKIQNYNYKNPYIFFVIVERAKLVMYVGAKSAPT